MSGGPLAGRRIVEFAGIGPAPFCGMLLADLGADVVRVQAPSAPRAGKTVPILDTRFDVANRGKRAVRLDLKRDPDRALAMSLVAGADALIEGFRPGTMERLGFSPELCRTNNPRFVYGRAPHFERGPSGVRWPAPARVVEAADVLRDWSAAS